MKSFPWAAWLEEWLKIAWLPLTVVFLIVAPFRSVLIILDEMEQLALVTYFVSLGLLLGAVLALWDIVREARKVRS